MWDKNLQLNALINYRQLSKLTVPVCCFVVCKTLELKISQQPENLIKVFSFFVSGNKTKPRSEEGKRTCQTNNKTQSL